VTKHSFILPAHYVRGSQVIQGGLGMPLEEWPHQFKCTYASLHVEVALKPVQNITEMLELAGNWHPTNA
jgi:hypothetical protein